MPFSASLAMLAAAIMERLPGKPLVTRDQIRRLFEDKNFDISEAKRLLPGWSPRSFEAGISRKLNEQGS
jgi:hypothetical protein